MSARRRTKINPCVCPLIVARVRDFVIWLSKLLSYVPGVWGQMSTYVSLLDKKTPPQLSAEALV